MAPITVLPLQQRRSTPMTNPENPHPLSQVVNQSSDSPSLKEPAEETKPEEGWFPEKRLILWHIFGLVILYNTLTTRTALLTTLSISFNFFGASRQVAPMLALIIVLFLPQHYFHDQDIYDDFFPFLNKLENLSRTMISCIWSFGVVSWLRFLCGWGL